MNENALLVFGVLLGVAVGWVAGYAWCRLKSIRREAGEKP
jgi:hypothetical protein